MRAIDLRNFVIRSWKGWKIRGWKGADGEEWTSRSLCRGEERKKRGGNGWTERDLGRKRGGDDIRRISRWETRLVNDDRDSWSGERPCYGNGGPLSCQLGAQVQTTGEQWDKLCKRGVTASSTSLPTFLPTYVAKNEPAGTWCDFRHRFHGSSRVIHTNRTIR